MVPLVKPAIILSRLILTVLALIPLTASANKWYEVDLVIFEDQSNRWKNSENWRPPIQEPLTLPEPFIIFEDAEFSDQLLFQRLGSMTPDRNNMMSTLNRGGNFRIIFSESWRQPIPPKNRSIPFVVRGGQPFGDRNEMEGTIEVYMGRYLHFAADLRLNKFMRREEAIAQGLFTPPIESDPLTDSLLGTGNITFGDGSANDNSQDNIDYSTYGQDPSAQPTQQESGEQQPGYLGGGSPLHTGTGFLGNSAKAIREKFVATETITMQQSRRMRSNELHYIDHPLMGIVIKIKKLKDAPTNFSHSRGASRSSSSSDRSRQLLDAPWER